MGSRVISLGLKSNYRVFPGNKKGLCVSVLLSQLRLQCVSPQKGNKINTQKSIVFLYTLAITNIKVKLIVPFRIEQKILNC